MSRKVRVAAGQLGPVSDDKAEVVEKLVGMVHEAGEKGVQILGFTEVCLTKFFPPTLDAGFDKYFIEIPCPLTDPVFDAAKERGIVLIFPYAEKDGVNYYNTAMVADADGTILGKYRKVHIPGIFPSKLEGGTGSYEKLYFKPGNLGFPVFDTAYAKIGVQICYDRRFPEGARCLALGGAEIVFNPTNAASYGEILERVETWDLPFRCRAYENGFFVVVPNKAGVEGVRRNIGNSVIVSPYGGVLTRAETDDWELVSCTIDLDEVARAQIGMPFWRDRRPSEYGALVAP